MYSTCTVHVYENATFNRISMRNIVMATYIHVYRIHVHVQCIHYASALWQVEALGAGRGGAAAAGKSMLLLDIPLYKSGAAGLGVTVYGKSQSGTGDMGIYIKSVFPGGAAAMVSVRGAWEERVLSDVPYNRTED